MLGVSEQRDGNRPASTRAGKIRQRALDVPGSGPKRGDSRRKISITVGVVWINETVLRIYPPWVVVVRGYFGCWASRAVSPEPPVSLVE